MPDPLTATPAQIEQQVAAYTAPLIGARLPASTLSGVLTSQKMVILHFLRHLGCIFCKHSVTELHKLSTTMKFPPIVFVHQSDVAKGDAFFDEYFPGAPHISDPSLRLYELFGIQRLGGLQTINPQMYLIGLQSLLKGNRTTEILGDALVLSGTFLFNNGRLVWSHRAKFAGDDPNWKKLAS